MIWLALAILTADFGIQALRYEHRHIDDLCQRDPELKRRMDHHRRNLDRLAHGEDWIPYRKVDR